MRRTRKSQGYALRRTLLSAPSSRERRPWPGASRIPAEIPEPARNVRTVTVARDENSDWKVEVDGTVQVERLALAPRARNRDSGAVCPGPRRRCCPASRSSKRARIGGSLESPSRRASVRLRPGLRARNAPREPGTTDQSFLTE